MDLGASLIGLYFAPQGPDDLVRKGREHLASPEHCEGCQGGCSVPNSWVLELCELRLILGSASHVWTISGKAMNSLSWVQ